MNQQHRPTPVAKSVLVVEDNRPGRILMQTLLDGLGCVCAVAPSGARALELCAHQTFDLILMDIYMPRMDGIEVLRCLRGGGGPNAATPVVALTANTEASDHQAFMDAGIAAIVVKPVSPAGLAAAINQCARTAEPACGPAAD